MSDAHQIRTLGLVVLLAMSAGACSSMAYRTKIDEFRNPSIAPERYTTIAILPVNTDGPDATIAARVRDNLRKQGVHIVPARRMVGEGEVSMKELCTPEAPAEYKGVLFVTWDRLILRDCETTAVAYRAMGNYSGVDQLAKKLVLYLRATPSPAQ